MEELDGLSYTAIKSKIMHQFISNSEASWQHLESLKHYKFATMTNMMNINEILPKNTKYLKVTLHPSP